MEKDIKAKVISSFMLKGSTNMGNNGFYIPANCVDIGDRMSMRCVTISSEYHDCQNPINIDLFLLLQTNI